MLIALSIFLLRRGLLRDSTTLLVMEAFFLVDAGFLNSEIFTLSFSAGLSINALSVDPGRDQSRRDISRIKHFVVGCSISVDSAQMLFLLALPGLFKHFADHHNGAISAVLVYQIWWIVGAIPVFFAIAMQGRPSLHRRLIATFILLPAISIIAHLCTTNWVYNVRWYNANLSPLLLGLAVAVGLSRIDQKINPLRIRAAFVLPLLAILLTVHASEQLHFEFFKISATPLRLTLLASGAGLFARFIASPTCAVWSCKPGVFLHGGSGRHPGQHHPNHSRRGRKFLPNDSATHPHHRDAMGNRFSNRIVRVACDRKAR